MTDRAALLAAVLDSPADDTARLVFADYLDDHAEPDLARFLRAGVTAARYRADRVIDDPDFYAALAELSAVCETGAPAAWVAALGVGPAVRAPGDWAWDNTADRVTVRVGRAVGVFERGMLRELTCRLDEWYAAAPAALAAWPVERVAAADVPGLWFAVAAPSADSPRWRLSARLRVPGRRVRLAGGVIAAALAPGAFLMEEEADWAADAEFDTRAALVAAAGTAPRQLADDLREGVGERWPRGQRS